MRDVSASVIVESEANAVSASGYQLRLAVQPKKGDPGVANFPIAVACLHRPQVRGALLRFGERRQVRLDNVMCRTVLSNRAAVDPDAARAKILHGGHVVRYKKNRAAELPQIFHETKAFFRKSRVAESQLLIYNRNIGI